MTLARIAFKTGLLLLILATGIVGAIAGFGERLVAVAIQRGGAALVGRDVRVGQVSIDWGRHTTLTATDLTVADESWSDGELMLRVGRAELTVGLLDALLMRPSLLRLSLQQPVLHLARNAGGHWNLPRGRSGGGTSGEGLLSRLAALRELEVEAGKLTVDDLASPGIEGRITMASLSMPSAAGGIEFDGTANWEGGPQIALSGQMGSVADLVPGNNGAANPFPVRLTADLDAARLSVVGQLARPLDLAGIDLRAQLQGDDLAPLLATLTAIQVATTSSFHATARVTDTGRGLRLGGLIVQMGKSEAHGDATLSFGQPRPRLSVSLVAPRIVLSDFGWAVSTDARGKATPASVADISIPTAWLRLADLDGKLRVEQLEGLATDPAGLHLGFKLRNDRLHVEPLRLELAQGLIEGTATIDAGEAAQPLLALAAHASSVQLGPLLAPFDAGAVSGTLATASIDLRGRGTTVRQVAADLDGAVRFRAVDGSLDLPGLSQLTLGLGETLGVALGLGGGSAATPVSCAVGDIPVRRGVAHTERLVILIPRVAIVGEGAIRLGEATIRLTIRPHPLDEALFRVVVPVVVSGEVASPEVTTHPELQVGVRGQTVAGACGTEAQR